MPSILNGPALEALLACMRRATVRRWRWRPTTPPRHRHRDDGRDYFAFIAGQHPRLRTMTLPFRGGLELTVCCQPL
jgi:hypothetical protein